MAKIGKETGKSQYKKGKSIFGEFFISQTNSQATPSPLIKAKMASIFFIKTFYHKFSKKSKAETLAEAEEEAHFFAYRNELKIH